MFVDFHILNELGSPSINSNTFANRPQAGQIGRLFVSTDTYEIYRDNGTTWDLIGGPGSSTVTGTGAATQVAYWTASQAIGGSNNLWWDNTGGYLGVKTNSPTAGVTVVQTDGRAILSDFTTVAGSGNNAVAIYGRNTTNSSGYVAVLEEKTPNSSAGQYPIKIMHSLSSGTAAANMATGIHFSLPDDAGTERINQLSMDTVDPAAATYTSRYRFVLRNAGAAATPFYVTAAGLGVYVASPSGLIHADGGASAARMILDADAGVARIFSFRSDNLPRWAFRVDGAETGSNAGADLAVRAYNDAGAFTFAPLTIARATGKSSWQATEAYSTGLARANYFDYNLSVAAGGSFSSPNSISAVGASLDLTLAGNATIPSGARSGLDAYNTVSFTGTGTLTHSQGTQIRAYSNLTTGWAFGGSATGTITHLAGLRVLFPDNNGSAMAITNNYGVLINDQTANTGTVTYTNRWGVYQEGASDLNYMAANLLLGSTTNNGNKLQVTGNGNISGNFGIGIVTATSQLEVSNSVGDTRITISSTGATGASDLMLKDSTATVPYEWLIQSLGADGRFRIFDNAGASTGERLTILQNGSTGICTNAPAYTLEVNGNTAFGLNNTGLLSTFGANNSTDKYIRIRNSSSNIELGTNATEHYLYGGSGTIPLSFYTNATFAARITSGQNFLIGTTTDAGQKLQVNGTINFTSTSVNLINSSTTSYRIIEFENTSNTSGSGTITSKLGANCDNATSYHFVANTGGLDKFIVYGNGTYATISDKRLKTNIKKIQESYLDKVLQLDIVNYNWLNNDEVQIGMIAQEVEKIIPEIVIEGRENNGVKYKSIQVSALQYILIKAIQELNEKIK